MIIDTAFYFCGRHIEKIGYNCEIKKIRKLLKKTFKIQVENKNPDRVVEAIKYEVRKYIKREKRKALPEDKDFWFFDCKFAKENDEPKVIEFVDITKCIDEAHSSKCASFYLEILARAEKREPKEIIEFEKGLSVEEN